MTEQERYVKRKVFSQATGVHYNLPGHRLGHMSMEVIHVLLMEKPIRKDPVRIDKEVKWMEQLKTLKLEGLNEKGK